MTPFHQANLKSPHSLPVLVYHSTDNQVWLEEVEDWKKLNPFGHNSDPTKANWKALGTWGWHRLFVGGLPVFGLGEMLAGIKIKQWKTLLPKTTKETRSKINLDGVEAAHLATSPNKETPNQTAAQAEHNDYSPKPADAID